MMNDSPRQYRDRFTDLRQVSDADIRRAHLNAEWLDNPVKYFTVIKPGWRCGGCGVVKEPDSIADGSWVCDPNGAPMIHRCTQHAESYEIIPLTETV